MSSVQPRRARARRARPARGAPLRAAIVALLLALLAGAAEAQNFVVTGRFQYVDKPWNWDGWTGALAPRPVRRADVTVLNNQSSAVIGQTFTGEDGTFSVLCSSAGPVDVVVRCDSDTQVAGGQRIRVLTESLVEYSAFSPVFAGHSPFQPLDIGAVTAQQVVTINSEQGNPFNLLDMGVRAADLVAGPEIGAPVTPLIISLFWPGLDGSFTTGTNSHLSEDDGYDDSVILHELGHCMHAIYSDNDSPGGAHTFGFSDQDPRLSFAEGHATFFAGLVLRAMGVEPMYVDADGSKTGPGQVNLRLRLETVFPFAGNAFGEADEVAVCCTLYDMVDNETWPDETPGAEDDAMGQGTLVAGQQPLKAWWADFVGPIKSAVNLTLCDAWDGWFSLFAADPDLPQMMQVWENRQIRFWPDAQEPDNTLAAAAPTAAGGTTLWSGDRTLYFPPAGSSAPGTGDNDHYAVPLVKGSVVNVQTRYPNGALDAETACDPFLEVRDPTGALVASADGGGTGRNALVPNLAIDATGNWTVTVRTQHPFRRYGRYNVQCAYVSQNHVPVITSGPTAAPSTVTSPQTSALTVTASDPDPGQTLSYAWTVSGGSIAGSGPAVTFVPPAVAASTVIEVKVVVSDNLGAESAQGTTSVTVKPGASVCGAPAAAHAGGVGKPGLIGAPVLVAQGLPVVPGTGFALVLSNALPGLPGFLVFGFSFVGVPFDGGTLYPSPDILLPVTPNAAGQVLFPIPLGPDPILCGFTLHAQVLLPNDPGASGFRKTAQSNFVSFTFGS